jgi:response regulator of citrate/malate metabolism
VDYLLKPIVKEELAHAVSKWKGWKNGRVLLVGESRGIQEVDDGMSYHQYPFAFYRVTCKIFNSKICISS